jgi:hypothetical protein
LDGFPLVRLTAFWVISAWPILLGAFFFGITVSLPVAFTAIVAKPPGYAPLSCARAPCRIGRGLACGTGRPSLDRVR